MKKVRQILVVLAMSACVLAIPSAAHASFGCHRFNPWAWIQVNDNTWRTAKFKAPSCGDSTAEIDITHVLQQNGTGTCADFTVQPYYMNGDQAPFTGTVEGINTWHYLCDSTSPRPLLVITAGRGYFVEVRYFIPLYLAEMRD